MGKENGTGDDGRRNFTDTHAQVLKKKIKEIETKQQKMQMRSARQIKFELERICKEKNEKKQNK